MKFRRIYVNSNGIFQLDEFQSNFTRVFIHNNHLWHNIFDNILRSPIEITVEKELKKSVILQGEKRLSVMFIGELAAFVRILKFFLKFDRT